MSADSVREFYRKQGELAERQRIIALINKQEWSGHYWSESDKERNYTLGCPCRDCEDIQALIALIKGDNK